jgi:uncharacterized protein YpuA (DUF1002 family)
MDTLKELWQKDKAVVIVFVVALLAILYYVYKQNNSGQGSVTAPSVSQTPDASTEQLSTILAALGQLTPVTNTLQPINTTTNNTVNNQVAPITTTITNSASVAQTVLAGIGNDTARDTAIQAAEKKYTGPSQAAALQAAIAAIQAQYPRTGATQ